MMKHQRRRVRLYSGLAMGASIALGTGLWLKAQSEQPRQLSDMLPAGASLYLEARDFHSLVSQWKNSNEKKKWLASANFAVLSLSRLLERLSQAGNEFIAVSGVPLEMNFVDQVAGARSAFAFYNLSRLIFVYVTEMPQTRVDATDLWRRRAAYQTRSAAGIPFFSKSDSGGQRQRKIERRL